RPPRARPLRRGNAPDRRTPRKDARGMSNTTQDIPADVSDVLGLPDFNGLTDDQTRGTTCVWHGGERLTVETAVDLGEPMSSPQGSSPPTRWFPRACQNCAADRAPRGLFAHCATCTDCAAAAGKCEIGRGLYRLVRDHRR